MANITRYDPFAELQALQKQFFGDEGYAAEPNSTQLPTTDIYTKDDKHMIVETHLPNFSDEDVSVDIDSGVLEIMAEKQTKEEDRDKQYVVRETSSSFYRRVRLPEQADIKHVDAVMENGVLKITVPFKRLPAPKRITIKAGKKK